jgi:hypothetical protein
MPRPPAPVSPKLVAAVRRFEAWRATRSPRDRIPKELWRLAASLSSECGLHRTARALRLDYAVLKKHAAPRCVAAPTSTRVRRRAEPRVEFVEVSSPSLVLAGTGCVVEFSDAAGTSMRIRFDSPDPRNLARLARHFLCADA